MKICRKGLHEYEPNARQRCDKCVYEYSVKYYKQNKEALQAANKTRYLANKKQVISNTLKWMQDNPEESRKIRIRSSKKYYYANKAKVLARSNLKKASRLKRTPKWADLSAIRDFYKNRPKGYHVDHILPLRGRIVSGLHTIENLQYLTAKENLLKGNR